MDERTDKAEVVVRIVGVDRRWRHVEAPADHLGDIAKGHVLVANAKQP